MASTSQGARPFDGIRILDLTHVLAGPFCTYQFALLGADVIKVENPADPDIVRESGPRPADNARGMGTSFLTQNSNKRCLSLDLKTAEGRDILKKLVETADVLAENYRVGALEELGVGPAAMRALNPRLIYLSMSAFGQEGPLAHRNGYDQVVQAMSGIMSTTGTPESGPLRAGPPIVDYAHGIASAFALSVALFHRERTGLGQHVDCAMLDTGLILSASLITAHLAGGPVPVLRGNNIDQAGVSGFRAKDGVVVMFGAWNKRQHRRFWDAVGRADLAAFDSLGLQGAHRTELQAAFETLVPTRTVADWESFCDGIGVPAGYMRNFTETLALPQLQTRNILHKLDSVPGVEGPITVPVATYRLEHGSPRIDRAPQPVGADTDAILADIGLDPREIAELRSARVV